MEVVFEVVSRAGRTIERHTAHAECLSIGRAFDNALILSDETVSPHHARLELDSNSTVVLLDLDSLNGVRTERHERIDGSTPLRSGEEYSFGRARVRIYETAHPVADTVRIGGLDWLINRLGSARLLAFILSIVAVVAIAEQWLNTYSVIHWQELTIGVFGVMAVGGVVAGFWAIVGRIAKHEGRFRTQLALVMLYLLLQSVIVYGYELLLFNSLNEGISTAVSLLLSFALLTSVLWLSLHIATHQASAQRWKIAASISGILLCISIYPEVLEQTEFSESPDYIKEIKPPAVRVAPGSEIDRFLESSAALFDATDHDDDS
jgi:hypothetical protein